MGREEPDEFEFGDLRGPLGRVRQVENQHSLWQKDRMARSTLTGANLSLALLTRPCMPAPP